MIKLISFCFVFCIFSVLNASAQGIVEQIKDKYEKIDTIKAEFVQILSHKESGTEDKNEGILLFKKPLFVNMQTIKPNPQFLIVTAKEVWNYLPDEKIVYKYPLDVVYDSNSLIKVITGQAKLDKDFIVIEEGEQQNLLKLLLIPKEPSAQMVEAIIWVDKISKLIKNASITDFYGNINSIDFINMQLNQKIDASKFSFIPPQGVKVEENTN